MYSKLNIFYFSDQWDDKWRRRQQIAVRLSEKEEIETVYYIELPLSITSFIKYMIGKADSEATTRWKRVLKNGLYIKNKKIKIITPLSIFPIFSAPAYSKLNIYFIKWILNIFIDPVKKNDICWYTQPFGYYIYFGSNKKVYDCTENFIIYTQWEKIRKIVANAHNEIMDNSQVIIVQTQHYLKELQKTYNNIFLVPNGTDLYDPEIYNKNNRTLTGYGPYIGFIGSMNNRSNWNLFNEIVIMGDKYKFILVGAIDSSIKLSRNKNVIYLGEIPYKQLPSIMDEINVFLLLYKNQPELGSPQKLFDYFSTGKPVISTTIDGVLGYEDIIIIANSPREFIDAIEMSLNETGQEKIQKRKELSKTCSWDNRFKEIWRIMKEKDLV